MSKSSTGSSSSYVNPTVGSRLVYQIEDMHRARITSGIVYTGDQAEPLELDVYLPPNGGSEPLPAVLLGGPPFFEAGKDSGQKVGWSQLIAASGLAAVAFDIRSDGYLKRPSEPTADVRAAIAFVRERGHELGIDPERLATLGFSFGTAPWHLAATMQEPLSFVRCNVVYYGPLDLHDAGVPMDPELADAHSATSFLRLHGPRIPPMLVAKAGLDSVALNRSIDAFIGEATAVGADARLEVHERGQHGFDVRDDDERSRAIIRDTLGYLLERLA